MNDADHINDSRLFGELAVNLQRICFVRNDRRILSEISWKIRQGEQAAILGPNGSGKSTLARIMLGYLWATTGQVRVLGRKFGETNLNELRQLVRLVQPNSPFEISPELTVREVVFTGYEGTLGIYSSMKPDQRDAIDGILHRVGLSHVADSPYGVLSTGERLRSQLARALIVQPAVLILDEPTAGLDIRGREELLDLLDMLGTNPQAPALVMVTHHTEELPHRTGNILLLDQGRVSACGEPEEVLRSEVLSQVYGCPVRVEQQEGRYYLRAVSRGRMAEGW